MPARAGVRARAVSRYWQYIHHNREKRDSHLHLRARASVATFAKYSVNSNLMGYFEGFALKITHQNQPD